MDAATLASLIYGLVSPFVFKLVPFKGNQMIAFTFALTLAVPLVAVLVVDQAQHVTFTLQRFLVDVAAAYSLQAALFAGAKQNLPAAVTEPPSGGGGTPAPAV